MKKLVAILFAIPLLAGCEIVGLYAGAAVVATAPVWVPIQYGVSQSKVKQPVEVVSSKGTPLAPAFAGEPKAKLTVPRNAVICKGSRNLSEGGLTGPSRSELVCNKGLKGFLSFDGLTTKYAVVTVDPIGPPSKERNASSIKGYQRCTGNFNDKGGVVAPFLMKCGDELYGAISPNSAAPNTKEFTVWLPPMH